MDKVIMEIIIAIREIKDILALHGEEISRLKKGPREESQDERLVKLALQGSSNLYLQRLDSKVEKKLEELEKAVKGLSEKFSPGEQIEREFAEEHLSRLRKALAE
ncbi:MAG: hypothetical protein JSV92_03375 [archaeon]|nr:MAG: hypothetical protein JSV92_03375 [archaeon]